jgi:hypothetical protein
MYNHYGERPVKFARVAIPAIEARIRENAPKQPAIPQSVPSDAVLIGAVYAQVSDAADGYELRFVYEHPDWVLIPAGEDIPELAAPDAAQEG